MTNPPLAADSPPKALVLHDGDNVAVALAELDSESTVLVEGQSLLVRTPVPKGHKISLADIPAGEAVRKFGAVIGSATTAIMKGEHVHEHNLAADPGAHAGHEQEIDPPDRGGRRRQEGLTFDGFRRDDGRVGTRNYLGVLTSVNCSATVARRIAQAFGPEILEDFPNVDGVVALCHGSGCGLVPTGKGFELLTRTIQGYATHPNFAGVLVLGLGCEVNQVGDIMQKLDRHGDRGLSSLTIQDAGGTTATVREGVSRIRAMLDWANQAQRTPTPVSELIVGLNCGGSDSYSGLTANPALGVAVDRLVANGATAVLGETPEIYGAEHLLTGRARTPEVATSLLEHLDWWRSYVGADSATLDNNPSPGNKVGGITTILEKSLGAVAKGGSSELVAVYDYAERIRANGLVFMDTPGYDPVSVTGIVAGGANVVCFTTGRGSVFGCKPVPSIKLCSNAETYQAMSEDMDIDCSPILDGEVSLAEVGERIFREVIEVASGRATKSEQLGFGDEEFAPWQLGVVM
ncbi:MAG: UxaA family hydrolase [Acidimicrobiales bacterium]